MNDDASSTRFSGFDERTMERARRYANQGRVVALQDDNEQGLLEALVRGSRGAAYEVTVVPGDEDTPADSVCSCPVGIDCKHGAAALMVWLAEHRENRHDGVDPQLQRWLKAFTAPEESGDDYAATVRHRLLYVLDVVESPDGPRLHVSLTSVYLKKSGELGHRKPYRLTQQTLNNPPQFILTTDRQLLLRLARASTDPFGYGERFVPEADQVPELLERLVATGRCYWRDADQSPLCRGEPMTAEPRWHRREDGYQRLELVPRQDTARVIPGEPPWYVDLNTVTAGPLRHALTLASLRGVMRAPWLSPEAVIQTGDILRQQATEVPAPEPLAVEPVEDARPTPVLWLDSDDASYSFYAPRQETPATLAYAALHFDYAGVVIDPSDRRRHFDRLDGDVVRRVHRNPKAESRAARTLTDSGLGDYRRSPYWGSSRGPLSCFTAGDDERDWWLFMHERVPQLRRDGWQVRIADDFHFNVAPVESWYGDVEANGADDWFSLELGIVVEGERVNLLPLLARELTGMGTPQREALDKLADDTPIWVTLDDGRKVALPAARLRPLVNTLIELFDRHGLDDDERITLSRMDAARLSALDEDGATRWNDPARMRALGERLRGFRGLERVAVPKGLRATLRGYQRDGLDWLQFLREYDFGGVLADDMGLGKTVQVLAHLLVEKAAGRLDTPSLVVAPTSLLPNWRREAERFAPELTVTVLHGQQRQKHFAAAARADLIVTSYALLRQDAQFHGQRGYAVLVLDEAQAIKNPQSHTARAAYELAARQRLGLSGTPVENNLGELWSLFHFVLPGFLGDRRRFAQRYRTPIEKQGDDARRQQLAQRVQPFLLRRTKDAVAKELPARSEIVHGVELTDEQRDLYETHRLAMHKQVRRLIAEKGLARSRIEILEALLKLRQVCCDPRLLPSTEQNRRKVPSAKLEALMDLLPKVLADGRRVLLFSQFTRMLALIEDQLNAKGIDYLRLTGDTRDRETPVQRFQAGEVALFLISLKAGGTGLNLTAADTVIHYDPWWNPAVEQQATDRAHRIGQDKPVFVYKLLCEGTVEERIQSLHERKRALAEGVYGDQGGVGAVGLTGEDLETLIGVGNPG